RKLEWFQKSGGILERQIRDVRGILKLQGRRLDLDYLGAMARDLGLADLLRRCASEAGLADLPPAP
ncbi:MAG: hypothetical protein ACC662_10560, partial [Planctomycetota bacterium]